MYSKTLLVFLVVSFFSGSARGQKANKFFRSDYNYIESVRSFYKIHVETRTWADAKRVCTLEGAIFWHPDNEVEANAVIEFWKATQPSIGYVYVGMSKKLFETTEGKALSDVYNKWLPGQATDCSGIADCVYIYNTGLMDDWDCSAQYSFICQKRLQTLEWNHACNISDLDYTFNEDTGKCYKLHTTPLSWKDAYEVCELEQSHLAVIGNRQDAEYLANFTESTPKPRVKGNYQRGLYHIGFNSSLTEGWQTVKGKPMNVEAEAWYENYQPDERDQCGSMFFNGRLVNTDCDSKSFFICEHESPHVVLEQNKE